jgi:competence protein ComEA
MWKYALAVAVALASFTVSAAVDVNQASAADLDGIKGIGPAVSARILDERKRGPFRDWNDLIGRIKGIGSANAARFSSQGLTVNGGGFKPPPGTPSAAPGKRE